MFLYKKKPSIEQQLMEQMKESSHKLEIANRDREISRLKTELALKDLIIKFKEVTG